MQIIECEQGSDEWHRARMGIPTASEFKTLIGVKKDARDKVTRRKYMMRLAGEIITGEPEPTYSNGHMERGQEMEAEARDFYSFMTNTEAIRVGFIRNRNAGCSPDSLIRTNGALEIKTALPSVVGEAILKGEFPPEHKPQCQGVLLVAEREWIDLLVYWPKMPPFLVRANRDEKYIAELSAAIAQFNDELAEVVNRLKSWGGKDDTTLRQLRASVEALPA